MTMIRALFLMMITLSITYAGTKPPSVVKRIDKIFSQWDKQQSAGCSASAALDGKTLFSRGYGMADLEHGIPNSPDTVFNIGSTSKQFAAFAIQMLVRDGKLSLDDDVRKYLPELHDFGHPINIQHLLHHTSGLRDALALLNLAGCRYEDVMSEQDLLGAIWRQRELNFTPGEQWMYSNTNYILLSVIVSRVSGMPFSQFAEERMFKPLGMKSTRFLGQYGRLIPRRARSYEPSGTDGSYQYISYSTSSSGAGDLYTTVEDLQRWNQNFRDARVGGTDVVANMHVLGKLGSGTETSYASGLFLGKYRGTRTIEHGGGNPGYRANALRFPDLKLDVVVLCNAGASANPNALARQIADVLLADRLDQPSAAKEVQVKPPAKVEIDVKKLEAYAGDYQLAPTVLATFSIEDGQLMSSVTGQPKFPVYATSERSFFLKIAGAQITFDPPDETGRSRRVLLRQGDHEQYAERLQWPLNGEQDAAYQGAYYSAELNTLYEITQRAGKLYLRVPRDEFSLTNLNAQTALAGSTIINFKCDDPKRCSGFLLNDRGRTRNLKFERIDIRPLADEHVSR